MPHNEKGTNEKYFSCEQISAKIKLDTSKMKNAEIRNYFLSSVRIWPAISDTFNPLQLFMYNMQWLLQPSISLCKPLYGLWKQKKTWKKTTNLCSDSESFTGSLCINSLNVLKYSSCTLRRIGLMATMNGNLRNPAILWATRTGSSFCRYWELF